MDKRFVAVLAAIFLTFGAVLAFTGKDEASSSNTKSSKGSNNIYGKADSPVILTEFVDFQCEACYAYWPIVGQIKEQYKDRVRFQIRNFPISSSHQFAFQAARSAEAAARQGKFFEMHDRLYETQKQWERERQVQPIFDIYAESLGLDMVKYRADVKSSSVNAVINKDLADVQALGGTGTPTFLLNGKLIETPERSPEAFSKLLDAALAKG